MTGVLTGPDEGYVEDAELFYRKDDHYHRCGQRHRPRYRANFCTRRRHVVCADINEKGAGETAEEVNSNGSRALPIKVDVTKRTDVDDMAERALAAFGRVQFLFNSAGAAVRRAKFLEIDDTLMEKTFALNVNGTLYCMQALLPHMLAGKHGVIVNMASMAHRRGGPGSSIHYAGGSKSTRTARDPHRGHRSRISSRANGKSLPRVQTRLSTSSSCL